MLISPKIPSNPYNDEEFIEMVFRVDRICGEGYSKKYMKRISELLDELSETDRTLNKQVLKKLSDRINTSERTPCEEIFLNSIYLEFYKKFRNVPLNEVHAFCRKIANNV